MPQISEDNKINPAMLDNYFSFMRGAKSANGAALIEANKNHQQRNNSKLFKDFCNEAEMEKNSQNCRIYFVILT
jgi:hypothetical protein